MGSCDENILHDISGGGPQLLHSCPADVPVVGLRYITEQLLNIFIISGANRFSPYWSRNGNLLGFIEISIQMENIETECITFTGVGSGHNRI